MFVDWAGQTVPLYHSDGTQSEAYLFVAVLGASNKTYVEAFANQQLAAWIDAHCHAYDFFQGVAKVTVPDYVARNIIRSICLGKSLIKRIACANWGLSLRIGPVRINGSKSQLFGLFFKPIQLHC